MEGGWICPAMALGMISEGAEQVIQIDYRTMLQKVMQALGARKPPVFIINDCGSRGVRVSIKMDVACAEYSVGQKIYVAEVESEPNRSRLFAEKSAVLKAFKHLNEKHLIKIKDFSSRVAHEVDGNSAFGLVNSAIYSLEKLIGQWEIVMDKCQSISVQTAGKEVDGNVGGDGNQQGEVYGSLREFMEMVIDMFKGTMEKARDRAKEVECERNKYHSRSMEKYNAELRKGYLQDVFLTAKEVLDYVLTYLGSGIATYKNGPSKAGVAKGVVEFSMPYLPGVEYGGNITIKGIGRNSDDAEENAAFEALLFVEKRFNLKIVDLNHAERVEAEKEQKFLVRILEQIVAVGDDVKESWGKMVKSIAVEKRAYTMDPDTMYAGAGAAQKREAYRFCAECIDDLGKKNTKSYEDCAFRFEEIEKMEYKLNEMKAGLEMD